MDKRIKNKVIMILLSCQVMSAGPLSVADTRAYQYLIGNINQTSSLINNTSTQIQTLGGIRTVMDDLKSGLNDAKSSLEGSTDSLKRASENLKNTVNNVELKSLFDMDAKRTTTGGSGIAYDDIAKVFKDSFAAADNALLKSIGGEEKLNSFLVNQYKLNKALRMNSIDDFKSVMNEAPSKAEIQEQKRKMLIHQYIKNYEKLDFKSKQNLAAASINGEWKSYFFPTTLKDIQKKEAREQRIEDLQKYVEHSKDIRQSIKTTNMLLFELLQLMYKEYTNALNFRNAMTIMYLKNGTNSALATELKERFDEMKKTPAGIPSKLRKSHVNDLPGANPFGIGWSIADGVR